MTDEKKLALLSREGDTAAFSILLRFCEKQQEHRLRPCL